jgi:hypothetical protein
VGRAHRKEEKRQDQRNSKEMKFVRHGRIHRLAMAPPLAISVYSRALHPQQGFLHR